MTKPCMKRNQFCYHMMFGLNVGGCVMIFFILFCRCSSLQSYASLVLHLLMMACPLYCQQTTRKCTLQDAGTNSLRSEIVLHKPTIPCRRQVLSIPLKHMYNNGTRFCEEETCLSQYVTWQFGHRYNMVSASMIMFLFCQKLTIFNRIALGQSRKRSCAELKVCQSGK